MRERIWEEEDGIFGGATVTDLPDPAHELPDARPGDQARRAARVSYTWGQDALQWGAMDEETRLEEALDDVARIHPRIREVYEVGASHAWYSDRWARGAFAMFAPGAADGAPGGHREPGGPDPLRRRALLAVPRLDPGRARVGHPGGPGDPRGARGQLSARPAQAPGRTPGPDVRSEVSQAPGAR